MFFSSSLVIIALALISGCVAQVSQRSHGQPEPSYVAQIPDGQLQVPKYPYTNQTVLPSIPTSSPAPAPSSGLASVPSPAPSGGIITQIPDGQPQAPAAPTVSAPAPSSSSSGGSVAPPAPSSTFVTAAGLQLQPGSGLSRYALAVGLAAWAWGI